VSSHDDKKIGPVISSNTGVPEGFTRADHPHGASGKPHVLPLNRVAQSVFAILVEDAMTVWWRFTNRDGKPMQSIKKGFHRCLRAGSN
jgi:hypothetical protein